MPTLTLTPPFLHTCAPPRPPAQGGFPHLHPTPSLTRSSSTQEPFCSLAAGIPTVTQVLFQCVMTTHPTPSPTPTSWGLLRSKDQVRWPCPPSQMGNKGNWEFVSPPRQPTWANIEQAARAVPPSSGSAFIVLLFYPGPSQVPGLRLENRY